MNNANQGLTTSTHWKNCPEKYYEELQVSNFNDALKSNSPSLRAMNESLNLIGLRSVLVPIIIDLNRSFNVDKIMTAYQVGETVDLIISEFPDLKLATLKLCFKNAKAGHYGKLFGKIDCQDILTWIRDCRALEIENSRIEQNRVSREFLSEEKRTPPSPEILAMFEKLKKELMPKQATIEVRELNREITTDQKWINQFDKIWFKKEFRLMGVKFIFRYGEKMDIMKFLKYKEKQYAIVKEFLRERAASNG